MGNTIPRKARCISAINLLDTNAAKAGEQVELYKHDNGWHMTCHGKTFFVFISQIRNPNCFRILDVH